MKKLIAVCLLLALAFSCAACGGAPARTASEPVPVEAPEQAPTETSAPVQEPETASQAEIAEGPAEAEAEAHSSVLVVYFSATGTTRGAAERIAALAGADLAEIVPAQPYTAEDLNYNDRTTRATVEQNTPDARPEIADEISSRLSHLVGTGPSHPEHLCRESRLHRDHGHPLLHLRRQRRRAHR